MFLNIFKDHIQRYSHTRRFVSIYVHLLEKRVMRR